MGRNGKSYKIVVVGIIWDQVLIGKSYEMVVFIDQELIGNSYKIAVIGIIWDQEIIGKSYKIVVFGNIFDQEWIVKIL